VQEVPSDGYRDGLAGRKVAFLPEPMTAALLALGLVGLVAARR
jgi:hypothetical protein